MDESWINKELKNLDKKKNEKKNNDENKKKGEKGVIAVV